MLLTTDGTLERAKAAVLSHIDKGETRTFDQIIANRDFAGFLDGTLMVAIDSLVRDQRLMLIAGRYTRVM